MTPSNPSIGSLTGQSASRNVWCPCLVGSILARCWSWFGCDFHQSDWWRFLFQVWSVRTIMFERSSPFTHVIVVNCYWLSVNNSRCLMRHIGSLAQLMMQLDIYDAISVHSYASGALSQAHGSLTLSVLAIIVGIVNHHLGWSRWLYHLYISHSTLYFAASMMCLFLIHLSMSFVGRSARSSRLPMVGRSLSLSVNHLNSYPSTSHIIPSINEAILNWLNHLFPVFSHLDHVFCPW